MAERGMAQIVAKGYGLHKVLVEQEGLADGPRDLRDLERMGEASPVMVICGEKEYLGLVLQPSKGLAVDDPVPVVLEGGSDVARCFISDPSPGIPASLRMWREV